MNSTDRIVLSAGNWDVMEVPGGTSPSFYIRSPDSVLIIPEEEDRSRYLIAMIYRRTHGRLIAEWPGGTIEDGEDAAAAAARELREETGRVATRLSLVGTTIPSTALSTESCHIFAAALDPGLRYKPDGEVWRLEHARGQDVPRILSRTGGDAVALAAWFLYQEWTQCRT